MPATLEAPAKTKQQSKQDKLHVFKLVSSIHVGPKEGWERPVSETTGKPLNNDPETGQVIAHPDHTYRAGETGNDIVRDRRRLDIRFGTDKFQLISGELDAAAASRNTDILLADLEKRNNEIAYRDARIAELEEMLGQQNMPSTEPGLDGMTKNQLVEHASEYGIDLGGARTKDEILAAIKAADAE